MRLVLRGGAIAVGAAMLLSGAVVAQKSPDEGVELTWVDGGGAYHDAVVKAWLIPISKRRAWCSTTSARRTTRSSRHRSRRGRPRTASTTATTRGASTRTPSGSSRSTTRSSPIVMRSVPGFATDYRIANMIYSMALAYNTEATGGVAPTGWADFFDLEKFPGKRGVMDYSVGGIFEIALLADGVPPDQLYPLDLDRAIASSTPSRTSSSSGAARRRVRGPHHHRRGGHGR